MSAERTARLLLAADPAARELEPAALRRPEVLDAARARGVPPLPARIVERLRMKRGALTWADHVAAPQAAARRAALGEGSGAPPRVLLRVDEFPHYRAAQEGERFGTDRFEAFHDVLAEAGIPYLIAALPRLARQPLDPHAAGGRRLDDREAATLARLPAEGVTLALHGLDHRTRRAAARRRSELAGLGAASLRARLDEGEAVLTGLGLARPRVFVAPYNRFDRGQWDVLAERYAVIGGGPETVMILGFQPGPAWRGAAVYLPAYPPLYGTAEQVLAALETHASLAAGLWVPAVLHWGWESDRGLGGLRRLAARLAGWAARWDEFLAAVDASR